jgi:hypothetical protein
MDLNEFKTDDGLEVDGVWVDLGDSDKTQLLIARIGNPQFNRVLRAKMKPFRNLIQRDKLPVETQETMLTETMADTILLDWKNLKLDGKVIKFSKAKALELMTSLKDFRELVTEIANSMETFRLDEEEEDTKNSKAS